MMRKQVGHPGGSYSISRPPPERDGSPSIGVAHARAAIPATHPPIATAMPMWKFSVLAKMPQSLVTTYGGELQARATVQAQLATVSSRFNAPGVFSGTFSFDLTGFKISASPGKQEVKKPHPGYDFAVVYDETAGLQGGWHGPYQAILHAAAGLGGSFSNEATDGLVHEFGHARGAIDVYAEAVDAETEPINHAAYDAPFGIMNSPYGVTTWDEYSAAVINASGSTIYQDAPIVDAALPPIFIIRPGVGGEPLAGVHIDVFPVNWYAKKVGSGSILSGITTANGTWTLPRNPFAPGTHGEPWNIVYPNLLIRARATTGVFAAKPATGYEWLPLSRAGAAAFAAPYQPYVLEIGFR